MAPNRDGVPDKRKKGEGGAVTKEEVAARGTGVHSVVDDYISGNVFSEVRVFFTGLMFLTRLPCPSHIDHHPAYFMRSLTYFPVFGLMIGLWSASAYGAISALWGPAIASIGSTLASVWLTGCFHEDGLSDSFDGFGGGWSKKEILKIMKDSRVGTYGAVGLLTFTSLKFVALTQLGERNLAESALIAAHVLGRATSAPLIYSCLYVQDEEDAKGDLYNWMAQSQRLVGPWRTAASSVSAAVISLCVLGGRLGFSAIALTICASFAAGCYGNAIIGGVMGDFLGATICITEVCVYMLLLVDTDAIFDPPVWIFAGTACLPFFYMRKVVELNAC
ncbi:unnamed protein product [Chrysoparadoxa australica]